VVTQISLGRR